MTALGRSATVNDQAARGQDREGARPHDPQSVLLRAEEVIQ